MKATTSKSLAIETSVMSIAINVVLSIVKLVGGLVSHSSALVSDAIHSASDVVSTVIVIVGVNISSKSPDKEHPYGHERMESISALLLAIVLCGTGCMIGFTGLKNIIQGNYSEVTGSIALISAVLSIVVKEWQYQYTKKVATEIHSDSLMADAWHHRSDALSSVGSAVGIVGVMLGFPVMDSVASIVICVFIIIAGVNIMREAIDKLVDKSCDDSTIDAMESVIMSQRGVRGVDELKTRLFGSKVYIDVTILIDEDTILKDAHQIAENVHDSVESSFSNVKHCMVHIHPYSTSN